MQCTNCGAENAQNSQFCERCGAPLRQTLPDQNSDTSNMMVWSILNLFLCIIVGFFALVTTMEAQKAKTPQEFEQKMKTAKTLNITASIIGGICIFIFISAIIYSLIFGWGFRIY